MIQNVFSGLSARNSDWKFEGEDGGTLEIGLRAVGELGVAIGGGRVVVRRLSNSTVYNLRYARIGLTAGFGLIPVPFNLSGSLPFKEVSFGTVYKGMSFRAGRSLELNEMTGTFMWLDISGDIGSGYGVSLLCMNPIIPAVVLADRLMPRHTLEFALLTSKAIAFFGGASQSLFPVNVGATVSFGRLWR